MKLINKKQTGFTLIELIIVIVILGILAVTAAPKFLDLQGDANTSTIQGVNGAVKSAIGVVYGKAIIGGVHKTTGAAGVGVDTNGDGTKDVLTSFGYPTAAAGILASLDITVGSNGDFDGIEITSGEYVISTKSTTVVVGLVPEATDGTTGETHDGCYVSYKEAASETVKPVIIVNTDGC